VDPQDIIIDKKMMYLVDGPDQVTVEEELRKDTDSDKLKWMVDYDVNLAREWFNGIQYEGDKSWYVLPMNQLAKEVIMERQISGEVTKFSSHADVEICSPKSRANLGITSVLYLGIAFCFLLGMDIERLIKDLVGLLGFLHLHMHPINPADPESTGKRKKRKTAAEKTIITADISPDLPNREHILFGSVHFINIIDFPNPSTNPFSLIRMFTSILVRRSN
jgi:hypothetical protein